MKYRDLIAVICLVALVVVAWSGKEQVVAPATAATPMKTPVSPSSPLKLQPIKASPTPEVKKHRFSRVPKPTVTLEIVELTDNIDDLTLKAELNATSDTILTMRSPKDPERQITISTSEHSWTFETRRSRYARPRTVKAGETLEWTTKLSHLGQPDDIESLKAIYGKQPLNLFLMLREGDTEANLYSRRLVRTFGQNLTIPAFKEKPNP